VPVAAYAEIKIGTFMSLGKVQLVPGMELEPIRRFRDGGFQVRGVYHFATPAGRLRQVTSLGCSVLGERRATMGDRIACGSRPAFPAVVGGSAAVLDGSAARAE
jgi:hypothetical protein